MIKNYIHRNLLRLDVEFGNSWSFFSGAKRGIYPNGVHECTMSRNFVGEIPGAKLNINEKYNLRECEINRIVYFTPTAESKLFDFVSRFIVISNDRQALIADREIQHTCSNIYHQYNINDVKVPLGTNSWLNFSEHDSICHPLFNQVFYIRDEAIEEDGMKRWIVHHRMIVKPEIADLVVRSCHPRLEGPLPAQWLIPNFLKRKLFRIREQHWPNFPIMSVGEISVSPEFTTKISTNIKISHD